MHEGGHRVPFIASWPGVIASGATDDATVMTMDFLPTFTNMAGATPPVGHVIDGTDLMPRLTGRTTAPQRALHWLFGSDWAVRRGAWKLIKQGAKDLSLVNIEQDLAETTNLAQANPALVDELTQLHKAWVAAVGNK
jgi:arylsulfatase A-like enzyme